MRFRNTWTEAKIISAKPVANNVQQIEIMPSGGTYTFTPGSHIDVSVFIKGLPEIRSYSLVGLHEPGKPYCIAVKRLQASKGGSAYMWTLQEGARLQVSQPMNHFELSARHEKYFLVAGGIGITPLIGMAKELTAGKASVQMLYAGSAKNEMPFIDELKECLGDNLVVHTKEEEQSRFDFEKLIAGLENNVQVYMCGPLGMMNAVRKYWEQYKKPVGNLRFETFGASGLFAPQPFKVKIPRLALELTVEENQSLLDVLNNTGADVMYDCKKGECGLCAVDILSCSGIVDHRDFFFSEHQKAENKKLCACVSRVVNGDITIDTAYRGAALTNGINQFT